MKTLLAVFALFLSLGINAQIDYTLHNKLLMEGRRAYEKDNYTKTLKLYQEAFHINEAGRAVEYLQAATSAAKLFDKETCVKWIKESVVKKNVDRHFLESYSDHEVYREALREVEPSFESLRDSFYRQKEDLAVYFDVQARVYRDQIVRHFSDYYHNQTEEAKEEAFEKLSDPAMDRESSEYKKYKEILFPSLAKELKDFELKAMRTADSLNMRELIEITKKHGWQKDAWILLWHQRGSYGESNWVWDYFTELINQEIDSGNVAPHFWAVFEDIRSIYKTGKSIYGYHPGKVDAEHVNEKRVTIGLAPLSDDEISARNENPYAGIQY